MCTMTIGEFNEFPHILVKKIEGVPFCTQCKCPIDDHRPLETGMFGWLIQEPTGDSADEATKTTHGEVLRTTFLMA